MEPFSDLSFFTLLMKQGSLAAAAQEMGVTPPSGGIEEPQAQAISATWTA